MKDFHKLDCSLKFADLFIVVLTTFNCWNQMIPYTIFGLSSLFSFQRSISLLCQQLIYHIIFIRRLSTKCFKKFFVVLYKRYRVDDLNIISLDLSHCQQEFEISFFISLSPSTSNLYILPLIGSLVNDIPIYFSIFLQMFLERLILWHFYGSEFAYHLASLVIFLAMLIYHLKRISVSVQF